MKKQHSYSFIILVVLLLQQSNAFEFLDYTEEHMFQCYNSPTEEQHNQMISMIILHEIDRYLFVIICPLTLLATSFIIYTFVKYPGTRNSPGDLLFGLSICEFCLNCHWFMSGIYALANEGQSPDPNGSFCIINSIISIPSGILDFAYNFILNIYISLTLKNTLKGYSPKTRYWHILMILSATAIIVIFESVPNWAGISVFGTCSYTSNRMIFVSGPLIGILYALLGVYMFKQFHKTIPDAKNRFQNKKQDFQIYYAYVKITSFIYLFVGFANLMIGLNCFFIHNPGLNIFLTITNILKLLSPVILSLLRYRDPILKKRIRLEVKNCLKRFSRSQTISQIRKPLVEPLNTSYPNNLHNQMEQQNINSDAKQQDLSRSFIQDDQFRDIRQFLRVVHLRSMVHGIHSEFSEEKPSVLHLTNDDFKEKVEIILDNDSNNEIDERFEKLSMRMTVHAPKVFYNMRYKDSNFLDFIDALNEESNDPSILKASGEGKGGASGEFFFFTHDNNLLLKTINDSELDILLKKLDKFVTHYEQKQESLITKIYGIFTFQQLASYDVPQHIIVMRNLLGIEGKYITRKYDLKGSTYQRYESIKNKDKNMNEIVLKDLDFLEFEQFIKASHEKKSEISQTLEFDSNYLSGQGFMDYSLLIVKVDWNMFFLEQQQRQQSHSSQSQQEGKEVVTNTNLSNLQVTNCLPDLYQRVHQRLGKSDQYFFQSEENPCIFYHIGIIDYLQQWTLKKSLERYYKNCINGKDVNTSAQPPRIYSDRFKQFIRKIFANS